MAEYTLKYINHRAECDAEAFVNDCEEHYHRQLHLVADQIAANCKRKPVVLLNTRGYWDPLIAMLERGFDQGFVQPHFRGIYTVADDPESAIEQIRNPVPWHGAARDERGGGTA